MSFGEINTDKVSLKKSYIYTPKGSGDTKITDIKVVGANSSTGSYESGVVNMGLSSSEVNITIDGVSRPYIRWQVENPGGSEGANSYKVTITSTN